MSTLIIHQGHQITAHSFDAPQPLSVLLASAGQTLGQPCGGRGSCGKCAVVLTGSTSSPNEAELRLGVRLACQAIITGNAEVTLPNLLPMAQIADGSKANLHPRMPMHGKVGAAIDIGTTTLALHLFDLTNGKCLSTASMLNPQTSVAGDVIGRIDAAMKGRAQELRHQIENAVNALLTAAGIQTEGVSSADAMVVTGNTTMLYLLTGRDPTPLSRAPFLADCFFGTETTLLDRTAYLPDCMHAFVGADTTCAILASGMLESAVTALLCDVGTNGELALWHQGKLYIASTAAGPAFEGAGISCGCASVPGAIDQVHVSADGQIICHTIGNLEATGVCGSGLVDAIAAMLEIDALDETGFLEDDEFSLRDGIALTQGDIRAVQLAKAATNAGIMSLLSAAGCSTDDIRTVYLAGGFGSHLNIRSAAKIGLIPAELADKVQVIGNAALDGAAMLLMDTSLREKLAHMRAIAKHVRLDGNPEFAQRYVDAMLFDTD